MTSKYPVGYATPPQSGQFKKGRSGNPKGRPKGVKNLKTDLEEELQEKISVTEQGVKKKLTKQRAMVKAVINKAMSGNTQAGALVIAYLMKLQPHDDHSEEVRLTPVDADILKKFEVQILSKATKRRKK